MILQAHAQVTEEARKVIEEVQRQKVSQGFMNMVQDAHDMHHSYARPKPVHYQCATLRPTQVSLFGTRTTGSVRELEHAPPWLAVQAVSRELG